MVIFIFHSLCTLQWINILIFSFYSFHLLLFHCTMCSCMTRITQHFSFYFSFLVPTKKKIKKHNPNRIIRCFTIAVDKLFVCFLVYTDENWVCSINGRSIFRLHFFFFFLFDFQIQFVFISSISFVSLNRRHKFCVFDFFFRLLFVCVVFARFGNLMSCRENRISIRCLCAVNDIVESYWISRFLFFFCLLFIVLFDLHAHCSPIVVNETDTHKIHKIK